MISLHRTLTHKHLDWLDRPPSNRRCKLRREYMHFQLLVGLSSSFLMTHIVSKFLTYFMSLVWNNLFMFLLINMVIYLTGLYIDQTIASSSRSSSIMISFWLAKADLFGFKLARSCFFILRTLSGSIGWWSKAKHSTSSQLHGFLPANLNLAYINFSLASSSLNVVFTASVLTVTASSTNALAILWSKIHIPFRMR